MNIEDSTICPFFCEIHGAKYHNEAVLIKCEAPLGVKSLFMTFNTPSNKRDYVLKKCGSFDYKLCPVAQMLLTTKYHEGQD